MARRSNCIAGKRQLECGELPPEFRTVVSYRPGGTLVSQFEDASIILALAPKRRKALPYLSYFLGGNPRTSYPTEQLTFQSNYFKNLDLAGRFASSSSDHDVFGFQESFNGRGRNNNAEYVTTGPIEGKRVSVTSDFGLTWHIYEKLRLYFLVSLRLVVDC